ncbi:MAG: DUF2953 domain-containing protein [Clostridia bacterium]|nr:DUF2953 domain-containing protein [Clostridia bacterium]
MPALVTLGIIALFLAFLLSLKATVTVAYNQEVELSVRVLCFKIKILPAKKKKYPRSMSAKKARRIKEKREKKAAKKLAKKNAKKQEKEEEKRAVASGKVKKEKKSAGEILDIISLVANLLKAVIGKFFGHLRIKVARIRLVIATGDAATTAITYGAVTQAINVLFPLLDQIKTVRTPANKDIDVKADFCSEESEIDIEISFALRVWHLFHVAFAALGKFIKYIFKTVRRKIENADKSADGSQKNDGHKVG